MLPDIYTFRAHAYYKLIQAKQRKTFFTHKGKTTHYFHLQQREERKIQGTRGWRGYAK